jgi:RNA polymerase sigma-70 factor (ECF subfamily)
MTRWKQTFTELVTIRGASLMRYAYMLCGNRADAADLVQEGLLRAFGRVRAGSQLNNVEAYVRRAILTAYLDSQRRRTRWYSIRHLLAPRGSVEKTETAVIAKTDMHDAMHALSARQRACLILRYYDDLPVAAIAAELGCSTGAVKRYLSEALGRMADQVRVSEDE